MSYDEIRVLMKKKCTESNLSQNEIAKKAGITRAALNRYINGNSEIMGVNLESLLNVFGMTLKAGQLKRK